MVREYWRMSLTTGDRPPGESIPGELRPLIGITMGDASGIGPEIIVKVLGSPEVYDKCVPVVLGDAEVLERARQMVDPDLRINKVVNPAQALGRPGIIDLIDYDNIEMDQVPDGVANPVAGRAAVFYTKAAASMAMEGKIDAVVSAPVNKEAMRLAGYTYEGQAQILAEATGASEYSMILILRHVRIMMLTTHMSLMEACRQVKKDRILRALHLAHKSLEGFGIKAPRIGVAALNPHAGENGLFGREEIDEIVPAVNQARAEGLNVSGPFPADSIFLKARDEAWFDLVLSLYHDQANIAAKLMGFGSVVTLMLGIGIIRTSVGHGTAFDIAWQNRARADNFKAALLAAADLAIRRRGCGGPPEKDLRCPAGPAP
ncbi:MAG: 4-hydroxythreonine-4-phosphate dehydrogenase PdxA [Thermoanaerobacteraceae bacterium]|nr:4-hydroxythreonine-4-phosphate dehydrogenase PdxA [Thermoanaerobacteraceae bacterium]